MTDPMSAPMTDAKTGPASGPISDSEPLPGPGGPSLAANPAHPWENRLRGVRFLTVLALLFLINLAARTAITWPAKPYSPPHDGCHYMLLGRQLARGQGYTNTVLYAPRFNRIRPHGNQLPFPDFQRPPLYPFLLSVAYRTFGESYFVARMVNLVLLSLLAPLTMLLGAVLTGRRSIGLLAAVFVSANAALLAYTSETMLEPTYGLCVGLFLLFLLHGLRRLREPSPTGAPAYAEPPPPPPTLGGWAWLALAGLAWGLSWYARHEAFYVMTVPVAVGCLAMLGWRRGALALLLILGLGMAVTAPWSMRTYLWTGDASYSELRLHLMAAYDDYHSFFTRAQAIPEAGPVGFLLQDPGIKIPIYFERLYTLAAKAPIKVVSGVLPTLLIGWSLWRRRGAWWRLDLFFVLWALANLFFFPLTFAIDRFLYVLIPLAMVYAADGAARVHASLSARDAPNTGSPPCPGLQAGAPTSPGRPASRQGLWAAVGWIAWILALTVLLYLAESGEARETIGKSIDRALGGHALLGAPETLARVLLAALLVGLLAVGAYGARAWRKALPARVFVVFLALSLLGYTARGVYEGVREHTKIRYAPELVELLRQRVPPGEAIMVYRKPYYYAWILDRPVVQIPTRIHNPGYERALAAARWREYQARRVSKRAQAGLLGALAPWFHGELWRLHPRFVALRDRLAREVGFAGLTAEVLYRFRVRWVVLKGRIRRGQATYYSHGWPPEAAPAPLLHPIESVQRKRTVYDLYAVDPRFLPPAQPASPSAPRASQRSTSTPDGPITPQSAK